ncbi:hypothetical protein [Rubritalea sp.]|uniref:hypothetical protein n=1 Tax=Rubritalea sp. TaxID=2109375 RepID=UPI003EF1FBE7
MDSQNDLKKLKNNLYHFNTTFNVIDANTGQPVSDLTTHHPTTSSNDLINQSAGSASSRDGVNFIRVFGIAYEPRKFSFSTPSHYTQDFIIDRNTESKITIKLIRSTK